MAVKNHLGRIERNFVVGERKANELEPTPEAILDFATRRAQQTWDEHATAYLLARLSPELREQGIDYKGVIGPQTLKEFVSGATDKLRVVLHPDQRSKIGIVPAGVAFEFPLTTSEESPREPVISSPPRQSPRSSARHTVMAFLDLVGKLDPAEAERVQIPTDILAKLARTR